MIVRLSLCVVVWALGASGTFALSPEEAIAAIERVQDPEGPGYDRWTFAEVIERTKVPGISVAVFLDFKIHWAKAYGIADVETGREVNTETLFQAASISKRVAKAYAWAGFDSDQDDE